MSSILFISLMNGAPWGGSEEPWYRAAIHAAKKGIKTGCVVYEWKEKNGRLEELANAGCTIFKLPNKGRAKSTFVEKLRYKTINKVLLTRTIAALPLKDFEITVVNQGGFGDVYSGPWKQFYKKLDRYCLTYHNYAEKFVFREAKAELLKKWMTKAEQNLFAAQRIFQALEKQLNYSIPRKDVFINPISFSPPATATPYPPLEKGCVRLSMLASLEIHRKAQDKLIAALSTEKWKQRNWVLNLYGEGKDRDTISKLIEVNGLQEKVFLKGHTDSPEEVLRKSHLVLQITNIDAMPLTVVEAMAMARPLVVSNIGDMPSWVHNNENGWVVADDQVGSIELALEAAWQKKAHWAEMGVKSFSLFQSKYPASPEEEFLNKIILSPRL